MVLAFNPTKYYPLEKKRKNKPGLQILSDTYLLQKNRNMKIISLGKKDWTPLFTIDPVNKDLDLIKTIDVVSQKHINDFWNQYNDPIPYIVEHKNENTSIKLFTIKKAHYAFLLLNMLILFKFRGIKAPEKQKAQMDKEKENDFLPIYYKIAMTMLLNEKHLLKNKYHIETKTTTIQEYKTKMEQNPPIENPTLPGYNYEVKKYYKLDTTDLPYNSAKDYRKEKKNPTDYASYMKTGEYLTKENLSKILSLRITEHEENFLGDTDKKKKQ